MNTETLDTQCAKCALSRIGFTVLVEGITVEQLTDRFQGRYLENFKKLLTNEIYNYHSKGLESIEIQSLKTHTSNSLIIDFTCSVNPKYNQEIRTAVRRALVSIKCKFILYRHFL